MHFSMTSLQIAAAPKNIEIALIELPSRLIQICITLQTEEASIVRVTYLHLYYSSRRRIFLCTSHYSPNLHQHALHELTCICFTLPEEKSSYVRVITLLALLKATTIRVKCGARFEDDLHYPFIILPRARNFSCTNHLQRIHCTSHSFGITRITLLAMLKATTIRVKR